MVSVGQEEDSISFDMRDFSAMKKLMEQYGNSRHLFFGTNEDGEAISISISADSIAISTEQSNGRIRKNVFYADGTSEEYFDGSWK